MFIKAEWAGFGTISNLPLTAKPEIRNRALQERAALPGQLRAIQSAAIARHLASLPMFQTASTVASYQSWASEPDTASINRGLSQRGAKVLVPIGGLEPGWRVVNGANQWITPESLRDAELIIVPALRVDYRGTRLGRGAGWYDRMLPHRAPYATLVALLFDGEYLTDQLLPRETHDVPMDYVVTPSGIHKVGPLNPLQPLTLCQPLLSRNRATL